MSQYAYYPGCSQSASAVEYDRSVRACCAALGVDLADVPDWSCCGSTPAHMIDHGLAGALSARNLNQAAATGQTTVTTPCPSCLSALKIAGHRMAEPEYRQRVEGLLDKPCAEGMVSKSILQILLEDVGLEAMKAKAVMTLHGLVAAPYYGCLLTRPKELMEFDDPENPTSMDRVITALGGKISPFAMKVECCGASLGVTKKEILLGLSGRVLSAAEVSGANVVVVACPLCHMNLDLRRKQINAHTGREFTMPVLYITQVIGLALGIAPRKLGLDKHFVDPLPLVGSLGKRAAPAEVKA